MKRFARAIWDERGIVFFLFWFLSILVIGSEVKENIAVVGLLAMIYLVFDLAYYGAHAYLLTRPLMKAIISRRNDGGRTITDGVIAEMASSQSVCRLLWLILVVGALQPIVTFIAARSIGLDYPRYWAIYTYLVFDLTSTMFVWLRIIVCVKKQRSGFVRMMRPSDLDELTSLEGLAFPDPDQQWTRAQVEAAVATSIGKTIVFEKLGRVVGALYTRDIRSDVLGAETLLWSDLAGDGDLTAMNDADTAYGVNLLVAPGNARAADKLLAYAYSLTLVRGLRYLMGCVRMPGYYKYADYDHVATYLARPGVREGMAAKWPKVLKSLDGAERHGGMSPDEYLFAYDANGRLLDPMVRKTMSDMSLTFLGRTVHLAKVVRCVDGYFGDPPSLDTGALMVMANPLARCRYLGVLLAPFVRWVMTAL